MKRLACPECREPMSPFHYGPATLRKCGRCEGVWVGLAELRRLASLVRTSLTAWGAAPHPPSLTPGRTDLTAGSRCPDCDGPMTEFRYPYATRVALLKCRVCDGAWLSDSAQSVVEGLIALEDSTIAADRAQQAAVLRLLATQEPTRHRSRLDLLLSLLVADRLTGNLFDWSDRPLASGRKGTSPRRR